MLTIYSHDPSSLLIIEISNIVIINYNISPRYRLRKPTRFRVSTIGHSHYDLYIKGVRYHSSHPLIPYVKTYSIIDYVKCEKLESKLKFGSI